MSRKGLSFDEKKARMLELFHEKKEFFQLKELEKLCPKEKGVTANSVKDVIQSLVDDGAIDTDKIGGSVYFWSFPSKMVNAKKRKLEELKNSYESSSKRLKTVTADLETAEKHHNVDDFAQTAKLLAQIDTLTERKEALEKKLAGLRKDSPVDIESMEKKLEPVKTAANRWTDNIFAIQVWCKKKFMVEDAVFHKQFGIPSELDYLP